MTGGAFSYVTVSRYTMYMPKKQTFATCTFFDMNDAVESRMVKMTEEMARGFHLIKSHPKSVTFFGSARFEEDNPHYLKARAIARRIAEELGYTIVTGGGPGIMEAGNRGAKEAGGQSVGFTIVLPHEQVTNPYLTAHSDFEYFFSRKLCMTYAAEAYVYFPGGFGTLDEFFEILTLVQTKKIECVPIVLVGVDFWQPLLDPIIKACMDAGSIDSTDLGLFTITDDEDEVLRLIAAAPLRTNVPHPDSRA